MKTHRLLLTSLLIWAMPACSNSLAENRNARPNLTPGTVQLANEGGMPSLDGAITWLNSLMAGMDVKPSGDIDRDFAAMMIPHHQGAIDMALAELRYGNNEQLRRIAQEIIVDQQQEIAAMRFALGQPLPPSAPAPTQVSAANAPNTSPHAHNAQ
jgi:uncharacterized protein (DUF305 family)